MIHLRVVDAYAQCDNESIVTLTGSRVTTHLGSLSSQRLPAVCLSITKGDYTSAKTPRDQLINTVFKAGVDAALNRPLDGSRLLNIHTDLI